MRQFLCALVLLLVGAGSAAAQSVTVRGALPTGTNVIGKVDARIKDSSGADLTLQDLTGYPWKHLDLDETKRAVDTDAGCLAGGVVSNIGSVPVFFKFYNATAAAVTVGSTDPTLVIPVAANSSTPVTGAFTAGALCLRYNALTVAATTELLEDGSPAGPATNTAIINLIFGN